MNKKICASTLYLYTLFLDEFSPTDLIQIVKVLGIVTRHFFYKKMFMIKVIQNFMEITLCFNCFSEKTCWKMLFNILFSVSIFDTMFLFWFVGGCCLVAIAWSRIRLQMSTKKKSKFKLEELFSASSFGVCLYIKSDLHKILDNFYLNGFHIEETTSYDSHTDVGLLFCYYY